jgi:two-component system, NarL family, sensor histidine kinase DegS
MLQMNYSNITHRRLLLFKWLMIFLPSATVTVGHSLIQHTSVSTHGLPTVAAILPVTFLGLVLTYIFVETLFKVIQRYQTEALTREQDIQTMNAVMQERERMSRELHDGAAQLVADLLVRLDTIKDLVETNRQHEAETELERLHEVADEIYEDIGESIAGLRTNVTGQGLIGALQDYVDQFEERHQLHTSLRLDEVANQLSSPAALQIFRFIQEALTNVRKHAKAREVRITLTAIEQDQLSVVIADNGQGFTPDNHQNGKARPLGMTSMRERIEALDGTFQVNSQPNLGTQVTATIPIPRKRRENGYATLATPVG